VPKKNPIYTKTRQIIVYYIGYIKFMIIARAAKIRARGAPRVISREGYKGLLHRGLYTIFSLLDTLKPFLIIIINHIILSDAAGSSCHFLTVGMKIVYVNQ
jgi:hypothetical protein